MQNRDISPILSGAYGSMSLLRPNAALMGFLYVDKARHTEAISPIGSN
jgi:hypothetical protein